MCVFLSGWCFFKSFASYQFPVGVGSVGFSCVHIEQVERRSFHVENMQTVIIIIFRHQSFFDHVVLYKLVVRVILLC